MTPSIATLEGTSPGRRLRQGVGLASDSLRIATPLASLDGRPHRNLRDRLYDKMLSRRDSQPLRKATCGLSVDGEGEDSRHPVTIGTAGPPLHRVVASWQRFRCDERGALGIPTANHRPGDDGLFRRSHDDSRERHFFVEHQIYGTQRLMNGRVRQRCRVLELRMGHRHLRCEGHDKGDGHGECTMTSSHAISVRRRWMRYPS